MAPFSGGNVGQIGQGSWIKYSHVTLPKGLASFTANLQTFTGVTAHLQVLVDAQPQAGCGLTDGGPLVGGQQIADLTVTPSSAQNFNGPYVNETTQLTANYPTGKHDLYLLATGEIGNLGSIQFGSGTLPAGWTHQDLGHPQIAGTAGYANGTFTLSGAGKSTLDLDHASQFAYQDWSGNGQTVAHVASQDSHSGAAGVMLRNGAQSDSLSVALVLVPGHGVQLISRASSSAQPVVTTGPALNAPTWLKLTRQGTTITGSTSNDGANWSTVATVTVMLNPSIDAGLVAASNDRAALSTATFDAVAVGPISNLPGTWTDQDLGTATTPGTASYSNGTYSVSSSKIFSTASADTKAPKLWRPGV